MRAPAPERRGSVFSALSCVQPRFRGSDTPRVIPSLDDSPLLDALPEPVLVMDRHGETLRANQAFQKLAARFDVPPLLASLFGPPARVLLAQAVRTGGARAYLPLVCGDDLSHGYRAEIVRGPGADAWLVMLVDLREEAEWRHQLFRRNTELSVLNDIGLALNGATDVGGLATRIWQQTGRVMNAENFSFALQQHGEESVRFALWVERGAPDPSRVSTPNTCGVCRHVLDTGQPLLLNGDVFEELERRGIASTLVGCRSLLAVPLVIEGRPAGVLAVADFEREGRYGRDELGILTVIATQAAAAVRTARLFETMQQAHDELARTQAERLDNERLRGVNETVGALNHEVNNPLATIAGTAQLLLRDPAVTDPALRERIERMLAAAKRIQQVTGRMSTLIQASSRPYPGNSHILDLARSRARDEEPGAREAA